MSWGKWSPKLFMCMFILIFVTYAYDIYAICLLYYFTETGVNITPPKVRIINETSCKEKVTLVCLAEDFYPDHVSIKWTLGSKEITEDVATDPYATQNETSRLFSMSSRLKVSKKGFTPKSTFTCTVTSVIDDKNNTKVESAQITGTGGISLNIKKKKLLSVNTMHLAMHA